MNKQTHEHEHKRHVRLARDMRRCHGQGLGRTRVVMRASSSGHSPPRVECSGSIRNVTNGQSTSDATHTAALSVTTLSMQLYANPSVPRSCEPRHAAPAI